MNTKCGKKGFMIFILHCLAVKLVFFKQGHKTEDLLTRL